MTIRRFQDGPRLVLALAAALAFAISPAVSAQDVPEAPPEVTWVDEPAEPAIPGFEDDSEGDVDISGPSYVLERISIVGNRKTMRQVILRYIDLRPGEVFSAADQRLQQARYRLLASGLFYEVELSLRRGSRHGWAILEVDVKERNTIVIRDFVLGFSEITPYGAIGVQDRSFLGSGVRAAASAAVSKDQWAYRLELGDNHFLDSDVGLRISGQFAQARDFFGYRNIILDSGGQTVSASRAVLEYDRAGIRLGTGYHVPRDIFLSVDFRFENIRATIPAAGSHYSLGERRPIEFGHLLPGHSYVSGLILGGTRDTRDHPVLPARGAFTDFSVELASGVLGSNYEFSKFVLVHDTHFPLGRRHSLRLGLLAGLIMGDAPFFDQFFIGDLSAFVPSRVLGLNFSHLHPSLLGTVVQEMRYEDLAASINLEYSMPFYRGSGWIYGVNGFLGVGLFLLASRGDLSTDPGGYQGYEVVPMDLTADLGIKIDTRVGVLVFSLANLFRLIPYVGEETAR